MASFGTVEPLKNTCSYTVLCCTYVLHIRLILGLSQEMMTYLQYLVWKGLLR